MKIHLAITSMSLHPRLHPRAWLLASCCVVLTYIVYSLSTNGGYILPAQLPNQHLGPHHTLLNDVSNATLGVRTRLYWL